MGRKIPGRKHRGIKDPENQAAVRFNAIKDKINAPPSNPDNQEIPKSLKKLIELKNIKNVRIKKNKNKKRNPVSNEHDIKLSKKEQSVGKPEKPVPVFQQLHGESDRDFVNRMNRICMSVTKEAEFEQKYGVDIKRNEDGDIEGVLKRPKDELELIMEKLKKDKKEKKKKRKKRVAEGDTPTPRLTKSQKRQVKLKEKKMKKQQNNFDEFKKHTDNVKFGEIVHAPPSLTVPRRAEKLQNAPRPGKKSLLLDSLIATRRKDIKTPLTTNAKEDIRKIISKTIDKKGKRKDLPHALRRQLEKQQKEIISAYKEMKSKHLNNT